VPDIAHRLVGAVDHLGHIRQIDRLALVDTDHQALDVGGRFYVGAGLHQHFSVAADQRARGLRSVRHLQRRLQILGCDAVRIHAVGVHDHPNHVAGTTYGGHVARAGNALEVDLGGTGHLLQFERRFGALASRIGAVEGQRDDGYVIDALGLDDGIEHTQVGRKPVLV
jgi:Holliday junction resolvase